MWKKIEDIGTAYIFESISINKWQKHSRKENGNGIIFERVVNKIISQMTLCMHEVWSDWNQLLCNKVIKQVTTKHKTISTGNEILCQNGLIKTNGHQACNAIIQTKMIIQRLRSKIKSEINFQVFRPCDIAIFFSFWAMHSR